MSAAVIDIAGLSREELAELFARVLVRLLVPEARASSTDRADATPRAASDFVSAQLLKVPEAAKLLGYAPSYVYEMLRRGDLPAVRDRKFVRVRKSALDEYIARHEQRGSLPIKVSDMLHSSRDRKFPETQAQGAGINSTRTR